jgi:hypothetical protein
VYFFTLVPTTIARDADVGIAELQRLCVAQQWQQPPSSIVALVAEFWRTYAETPRDLKRVLSQILRAIAASTSRHDFQTLTDHAYEGFLEVMKLEIPVEAASASIVALGLYEPADRVVVRQAFDLIFVMLYGDVNDEEMTRRRWTVMAYDYLLPLSVESSASRLARRTRSLGGSSPRLAVAFEERPKIPLDLDSAPHLSTLQAQQRQWRDFVNGILNPTLNSDRIGFVIEVFQLCNPALAFALSDPDERPRIAQRIYEIEQSAHKLTTWRATMLAADDALIDLDNWEYSSLGTPGIVGPRIDLEVALFYIALLDDFYTESLIGASAVKSTPAERLDYITILLAECRQRFEQAPDASDARSQASTLEYVSSVISENEVAEEKTSPVRARLDEQKERYQTLAWAFLRAYYRHVNTTLLVYLPVAPEPPELHALYARVVEQSSKLRVRDSSVLMLDNVVRHLARQLWNVRYREND